MAAAAICMQPNTPAMWCWLCPVLDHEQAPRLNESIHSRVEYAVFIVALGDVSLVIVSVSRSPTMTSTVK